MEKVFVLTIIDQDKVGSSPDKVFTFSTNEKAVEKMKRLFSQEANVPYENIGERYEDKIADTYFCERYAYINFYWYADIYECKVDEQDRKEKLAELTKDMPIPSNHRELCSKLTDEQYYDMMFGIYKDIQFTQVYPETMSGLLQKLWDTCDDILYRVVWGYGTDEIMDKYSQIKLDSDNLLYADYDYFEYTSIVDELVSKYKITPLE